MGNTFNIQNRLKNLITRTKTPDSKIGSQSECPKCGEKFPKNITYEQFDQHLQACLLTSTLHQPSYITQTEVYIKKVQKGKVKWLKHFVKIDPNIYKSTHYQMRNRSFPQKLAWFYNRIDSYRVKWQYGSENLIFSPQNIVLDSMETVLNVDLRRQLKLSVMDDKVSDAGGILREWSNLIIKSIVRDFQMFKKCDSENISYKLNRSIHLDERLYQLLGAIIGKAIFQKVTLETHFDHTFLKQLLDMNIQLTDIKSFDQELYKGWNSILLAEDIDIQLVKVKPFCQSQMDWKQQSTTQINYYSLKNEFYCQNQQIIGVIRQKLDEVIPIEDLQIFEVDQFQVLLNGVDYININDWKEGTVYRQGINEKHKVVQWLWEVLEEMSQQDRGSLLKYVTGSSRLPIFGFKKLEINRGKSSAFTIEPMKYDKKNPLPKAHTCFNRLLLPLYPSKQILRVNIQQLIKIQFDGIWGLQ